MPNADEILGAIAEYVGEDKAKARELALEMLGKPETKPVAQVLLQRGLSKRAAEATGKASELEAETARLRQQVEEQTEELEQLRAKEPNFAKTLSETETRWKKKVDEATARAEQAEQRRREKELDTYRQKLMNEIGLGKPGGVEEEWGEVYIPGKYYDRILLEDGDKLRVLEPGTDTPYDPADGDPIKQLAEDVKRAIPPKYRLMGTATGGGGQNPGSNGARPKTEEQIRDAKRQKVGYATP